MSKAVRLLFFTFATLALGWAQTFGMQRGFVCDCHGDIQITWEKSCPESAPEEPHHADHDEEESHQHPPVVDPLIAQNLSFHQVQAPPLMLWEAGWIWQPLPLISPTLDSPDGHWRNRALRRCPLSEDWPHQLSQAISLRL